MFDLSEPYIMFVQELMKFLIQTIYCQNPLAADILYKSDQPFRSPLNYAAIALQIDGIGRRRRSKLNKNTTWPTHISLAKWL